MDPDHRGSPVRHWELWRHVSGRCRARQEGRGAQDMMILIFISGVILGGLPGMLMESRVSQRWPYAGRRTNDIDRLVEQIQALFRQRDQEHHPRP
jgi:hypothetical protein